MLSIKDIQIPEEPLKEFKHIILTGKNGSGKTTILKRIALIINEASEGKSRERAVSRLRSVVEVNKTHSSRSTWEKQIIELSGIDLRFSSDIVRLSLEKESNDPYIFSFFKAHRKVLLSEVTTVTTEENFTKVLNKKNDQEDFTKLFKQYLVNKKVYEAFDYMNDTKNNRSQEFFNNLTISLRNIFSDQKLELEFKQESFEFYIVLGDQRKITFNNLSEGFSAFLSVIMDLLIRTDLIQKLKNDYTYQPEGIVLIDEPETHLHLSMQYDILPLISKLFPKVQLIIATHSPAIISSLENSIVYDLSSKSMIQDKVLGSSFSELMVTHFGLDNEYSPIADKILEDVNNAAKSSNVKLLHSILSKNEKFITPVLRLDIESLIIKLSNK